MVPSYAPKQPFTEIKPMTAVLTTNDLQTKIDAVKALLGIEIDVKQLEALLEPVPAMSEVVDADKPVGKVSKNVKALRKSKRLETQDTYRRQPVSKSVAAKSKPKSERVTKLDASDKSGFKARQSECKALGLSAKGDTDTLSKRVQRYYGGTATKSDFKKSGYGDARKNLVAKLRKGVKKTGSLYEVYSRYYRQLSGDLTASDITKSASRGALVGISYRDAQKTITAIKKAYGKHFKDDISNVRNAGWDNIAQLTRDIGNAMDLDEIPSEVADNFLKLVEMV